MMKNTADSVCGQQLNIVTLPTTEALLSEFRLCVCNCVGVVGVHSRQNKNYATEKVSLVDGKYKLTTCTTIKYERYLSGTDGQTAVHFVVETV